MFKMEFPNSLGGGRIFGKMQGHHGGRESYGDSGNRC